MTDWPLRTIGDLADWRGGMTPSMAEPGFWSDGSIPWISSSEVVGGVLTGTARKVTQRAVDETALRLASANSVAIVVRSGILAHTFPVALVPFRATVNQDVKIGQPREGVAAEFLAYTLENRADEILRRFRKTGTTVQSIDVRSLMALEVPLPPLAEQYRIVTVASALDQYGANSKAEEEAAGAVLDAYLSALEVELGGEKTRLLGDVAVIRSGPSWSAPEETAHPVEGATPVIKITNTPASGRLDLSTLAYVRELPPTTSVLAESDLVMIRTNGNRTRIGNVYLPGPEAHGCAVSAFQFLIRADGDLERAYLYWWLRRPELQRSMSAAASGSTGLGNLAVRWLKSLEVPWPDRARMVEVIEGCAALWSVVEVLREERLRLRGLRARLLADLLSQRVELPEELDEVVKEAA